MRSGFPPCSHVLSYAQVITSRAPRNIKNWTNHIHGAASLLKLRGPDQFMTEEGLGLFLQLRFQIVRPLDCSFIIIAFELTVR